MQHYYKQCFNPFQLTTVRVVKILQEFEALGQASKDGELSVERIFSEEQIKNCHVIHSSSFPVRVRHRDLVQIWK